MKRPNDVTRLRHMLEAAEEAREFLGGAPFEDFQNNRMMANAIIRSLEVLGEAASQISDAFRGQHPELEWRVMAGMRNRLIHAYFAIDYQLVWQTANNDLPELIAKLKNLLPDA